MEEILFRSGYGHEFVKEVSGDQALVRLKDRSGGSCNIVYTFRNIPPFEHPMLSWENLDKCNAWPYDEAALVRLVRGKKKPAGQFGLIDSRENIRKRLEELELQESKTVRFLTEKSGPDRYFCSVLMAAADQPLSSLFCLEDVFCHYEKLGVSLRSEERLLVTEMAQLPLINLLDRNSNPFGFDYAASFTRANKITTGLLLGYPLESTASFCEEP